MNDSTLFRPCTKGVFALSGLMVLATMMVAEVGHAQEAEPSEVVVLAHPYFKGWAKQLSDNVKEKGFVIGPSDAPPPTLFTPGKVRLELGTSVKAVKEWNYLIQLGVPRVTKRLEVPCAIFYRKSAQASPVVIAQMNLSAEGRDAEATRDLFCKHLLNQVANFLQYRLAFKILTSQPVTWTVRGLERVDSTGTAHVLFPLEILKEKEGPVAAINLHNRLPFKVGIQLSLHPYKESSIVRTYTTVPGEKLLLLEAGEKRTLTVPLAKLDGLVPSWATMETLRILDPNVLPHKE